jgi:transposase
VSHLVVRAYYRRKLPAGKTSMEAMRCLKRRLSDIVCRQLVNDQKRLRGRGRTADPGGQAGAATDSSAAGSNPDAGASEKSLPGPAGAALRQPQRTFITILRAVPEALDERRPAAAVKRSLLDDGEVRRSIARG